MPTADFHRRKITGPASARGKIAGLLPLVDPSGRPSAFFEAMHVVTELARNSLVEPIDDMVKEGGQQEAANTLRWKMGRVDTSGLPASTPFHHR